MAKKTTKRAAKKTTARKTTRKAAKSTRKAATKTAKKTRKAVKRELIDTGTDKRYVRRGAGGQFDESDDVGRSLASDRRKKAKTKVKSGQGDKGDR
jgi:hypothetical protein